MHTHGGMYPPNDCKATIGSATQLLSECQNESNKDAIQMLQMHFGDVKGVIIRQRVVLSPNFGTPMIYDVFDTHTRKQLFVVTATTSQPAYKSQHTTTAWDNLTRLKHLGELFLRLNPTINLPRLVWMNVRKS